MVSPDAVKRLIQRGEGNNLEFKRLINDPRKIAKSMVAFANSSGGILLIGINDNGSVYGVPDEIYPQELLVSIANKVCSPEIRFSSETVEMDGKFITYVTIPESKMKPHFLKNTDGSQTAYIRSHDKSVEATQMSLKLMENQSVEQNNSIEMSELERMLFDFLAQYGIISFEKYKELSGLEENLAVERLNKLIKMGILKLVIVDGRQFFSMTNP